MARPAARIRPDKWGPRAIEAERRKSGPGIFVYSGKRFCETCQQFKPRGTRVAVKGWKCDGCREVARG